MSVQAVLMLPSKTFKALATAASRQNSTVPVLSVHQFSVIHVTWQNETFA